MSEFPWPHDMQPTGKSYLGIWNGKAVAIAMQFTGKRGEKSNREVLRDYAKAGFDIQTLPHDEASTWLKRDSVDMKEPAP